MHMEDQFRLKMKMKTTIIYNQLRLKIKDGNGIKIQKFKDPNVNRTNNKNYALCNECKIYLTLTAKK
eukprot:14446248-Ditylum_brightwellii.AAC.1